MPANLPVAFGALLTGGLLVSKGISSARGAFGAGGAQTSPQAPSGGNLGRPSKGNPFAHLAVSSVGRTDEGVDLSGRGPIVAPEPGTVRVYHYSGFGPYVEFLPDSGGPALYFAEGLTPAKAGRVSAGDIIAHVSGAIETGISNELTHLPLAKPHYTEGAVTPEGLTFRQWLKAWGVAA